MNQNQIIERIADHPFQKIEDTTVIVDTKERMMHQLNDLGSRIWELLDKKKTFQELITLLAEEYEADIQIIRADAIKFLEDMSQKGLVRLD
ncbi:MAG: PqqD family protein [Candidatus Brocadiia bacterium]